MPARPFSSDATTTLDPTLPGAVQTLPAPRTATPASADLVDVLDPRWAPHRPGVRHASRGGLFIDGLDGLRRGVTRRADAVTAAALVVLVAVGHSVGLFGFPTLTDDEGTYVAQAAAVRGGELAHYTYWYDHPPLGWIQLGLLDWIPQLLLPGVQPVAASRVVLVAAACVAAALTFVLARRIGLSRPFAAAGVALGFLSPLSVIMQRQVYLDNIAVPWLLLAFVLVLDRRQRLWMHVAAGAAFAVAVGTKETMVVLLPVLVWAVVRHSNPRTRAFSVAGFAGAASLVGYYPLTALLRGELLAGDGHVSLADAVVFQLLHRPGSGAMWDAGSASNVVLQSWLYYDRWLIGLGLLGVPLALAVRRLRPLGFALLVLLLVALKPGGYLPAMYVIAALPLFGLSAAATAEVGWAAARRRAAAWGRPRRLAVHGGLVAAALALVLAVTVDWTPALTDVMTQRSNDERAAADGWLASSLPRDVTVLADDVTWVSLVTRGVVPRDRAVWFYKLDTDPEIQRALPGGWRDIDYIVVTDQLRSSVTAGDSSLTQSTAALQHSRVVATFGEGESAVQVRKVDPTAGTAAGAAGGAGVTP